MAALRQLTSSRDASVDLVDDHGLLSRLRAADVDALAELYDRHGARAFALALHVAGDELVAERATQRVFLVVWRSRGEALAGPGTPGAILLALVHRNVVDLLRSGEHAEAAPPAGAPASPARRTLLDGALESLDAGDRRTLELAYYRGMTDASVAAQLDAPVGFVRRRLLTGLLALRDVLAERDAGAQPRDPRADV